ncbi:Ger(x)C family spore germination protein [Brevibacillus centrosporus]|uniref:Ger(x)C family spore germination protein n=1 Tax=Brevibacillus centrosporus TaxID=54910 RepID=UPI0039869B1B
MRSKWITSVLLTCLLTLLSGCWDQKSIQDMIYLSAFGIDFVDNEYVIYAQSSDLASVAKQEGAATGVSPPAVVSIGRGETLQNALDNLQKNSQVPMFAGFISSIIYHERLLKRNILPSYDILNRYGLVRYTKWVFGTREPLQDVLSNHALTGFSPLISLLHQPEEVYKQRSFIEPIQYFKFIERFWNPSSTIALPNITIYERSWKENNKFVSRLSVDGIHAIHRGKWEGFFPNTDLLGLRWMNPHTEFAGVIIRDKGKPKATLRIKNVRLDVHPVQKGVKPTFHVHIYMKAFVREVMGEISNEEIKRVAEKEVIEQVRGTFLKGIERGADLFNFEEALYKKDVEAWKQFAKNHENKLSAEALDGVTVHLYLSDSGKLKQNWFYPDDLLPK